MAQRGRGIAAIAAAVVALVGVLGTAGAAHAADPPNGVVSAAVAPGSRTNPSGSFYAFQARPGDTITQQVLVRNVTKRVVTANVAPVDAITADATGVAFPPAGDAPAAVGRWMQVATPQLTLQGSQKAVVTFTVHVPDGTAPGVHLGGISVYSPTENQQSKQAVGSGKTALLNIRLQPRRVIAVEVTVPGPKAAAMVITGTHAAATPDGVALVVQMRNRGNDYARGTGTLEVPDTQLSQSFAMNTFVPGTAINFQVPWTKDVVAGTHAVSVALKYGSKRLNWNGNVKINGATRAQLEAALAKSRGGSGSGFPILLVLLLALLLAACCVAGGVVLRRRRATPRFAQA